jgi:anaerobic magnesium-protoporphyrin IX monomethyl ester cyclase
MDVIEGLMKLDYFLNHKYKPRKIWWQFTLDKSAQTEHFHLLAERPEAVSEAFAALHIGEKDLHKHVMIEVLSFRLDTYLQTGKLVTDTEQLLIVYFPPDAAVRAMHFTMDLALSTAK